jgi:hypothetical protein
VAAGVARSLDADTCGVHLRLTFEFEDHVVGGVSFGFVSETMSMTLRGATSTQQLSCQ